MQTYYLILRDYLILPHVYHLTLIISLPFIFFESGINLHDLVATKVACITRTPYND